MESKNSLKPIQKAILEVVEKYPGLSIKEFASKLRKSFYVIWNNVNVLEYRLGLLESCKRKGVRQVYLKNRAPMGKFALDELEVRLLEEVNGDEPFQELAEKFKVVANQIEARIERSIPFKFEVVTFGEAKANFLKYKKETATLSVV